MIHPAGRPERPGLEVADVLRRHGPAYTHVRERRLGRVETRVISAITACRTAALGGHVEACADCGATRIAYNSCRNRHCPSRWKRVFDTTCQGAARAAWLEARQAELLPVPYFHIVFTLPQRSRRSAGAAMTTLAANPRRLGAKIGGLAVLHTSCQRRVFDTTARR